MGEELYRYQRRPYIDRHWNLREIKMGKERKSERFPPEIKMGPQKTGGRIQVRPKKDGP